MRHTPTDIEYDSGEVEFVETTTSVLHEKGLHDTQSFRFENTPKEGIKGEEAAYAGPMDVDRERCAQIANESESKKTELRYVSMLILI